MKRLLTLLVVFSFCLFSCSKNEDENGPTLSHVGQKWRIASLDYNIVDMGLSNPMNWVQTGTATNAGYFYLNGSEGSFDIVINGTRKEDYFGYTTDGASITIIQVEQSISPSRFSQNVITFSGEKDTEDMTLSGTITSQAVTNQYVFTGSNMVLVRE
jgi:hypothetical protein